MPYTQVRIKMRGFHEPGCNTAAAETRPRAIGRAVDVKRPGPLQGAPPARHELHLHLCHPPQVIGHAVYEKIRLCKIDAHLFPDFGLQRSERVKGPNRYFSELAAMIGARPCCSRRDVQDAFVHARDHVQRTALSDPVVRQGSSIHSTTTTLLLSAFHSCFPILRLPCAELCSGKRPLWAAACRSRGWCRSQESTARCIRARRSVRWT
jgi:hypothetical protein